MTFYHDEVEIEDFEYDKDEDVYYYPCPCGDQFQISKADLIAGEEEATCPSCSLVIKVIYDKEEFAAKQEEFSKSKEKELMINELVRMAGCGRGRGKPMSVITEQLGFGKGEALPPPTLQPPPKYLPLDHKPLPINITNEMSYLLELKRDFAEFMRESHNNVQPFAEKKDIERYSDRYQDLVTDKTKYESKYDWSKFPTELKPIIKKRKAKKSTKPTKKQKNVDIESKLQELEKKESTQQSDTEADGKEEEESEEKDIDEQIEDEEEDLDEQMDEGTDYANNYFDNGEGYDEEEDNLDDGPVY